jgi:hypothetical protein
MTTQAVVRQMTEDQRKVLKMAIEKTMGGNNFDPPHGVDGKGLVMKVMGMSEWPSDGFHTVARQIIYCAIADEWPAQKSQT